VLVRADFVMKVRVYRNLNRKCLSVQRMTDLGWRVSFYASMVKIEDANFVVHESGRIRTVRTGIKNVHAYVIGTLIKAVMPYVKYSILFPSERVSYNPMRGKSFSNSRSEPVYHAREAVIVTGGIFTNSAGEP
jgi:hypothetical protein